MRGIFFLLFFLTILSNLNAQTTFTKQLGYIVYGDFDSSVHKSEKEQVAKKMNDYILKTYSKRNKIPLVYLVVSYGFDTTDYELSYDNFYGNSVDNATYERKGKYFQPGIRIKVYSSGINLEEVLKLLDYGINHIGELKSIRAKALEQDHYDRPATLSISKQKIKSILML